MQHAAESSMIGRMASDRQTVLFGSCDVAYRASVTPAVEAAGMDVIAETCDYDEVIDLALELRPDICLIDVGLLGGSGVVAAGIIASVVGTTSTVILGPDPTMDDVLSSVSVGAAGYLPKTIEPARLAAALAGVGSGEHAFPRRELRQALGMLVPEIA